MLKPGEAVQMDLLRTVDLDPQAPIHLRPVSIKDASDFVAEHHRHHRRSQGAKFAIGIHDGQALRGVALVGRPVARNLDDGYTAEVIRVCTDGVRNGCSMLYGACARAAKGMGYRRVVTYILDEEAGVSLKAAGWRKTADSGGGSWSREDRERVDTHPLGGKTRWEAP